MIGVPKPTLTRAQEQRARKAKRDRMDREESLLVRERCHGRCEVVIDGVRCFAQAEHVHHLLGGNGRRAVHDSMLADFKVAVCRYCHDAIHAHRISVSWQTRNPQDSLEFQR